MLPPADLESFHRDGFVAIRGAVESTVAAACADAVWAALERHGVERSDPSTWTEPVVRIDCPYDEPFLRAGSSPVLAEAYDALIGVDRWLPQAGVGGTIPVRFPSEADPGDAGWHIDASHMRGGAMWVDRRSSGRALLSLFLFTDVDESDAPTRLRPGSHRDVPPLLEPFGDDGTQWFDVAVAAAEASAHRPTVLATGRAGDVFVCHPFLVHAASFPHRGSRARMVAQAAIAPT